MLGDPFQIFLLLMQLLTQIKRNIADTNHPVVRADHNQVECQLVPLLASVVELQIFVSGKIQDLAAQVKFRAGQGLPLSAFDEEVESGVDEGALGVNLPDVYILTRHTYNYQASNK